MPLDRSQYRKGTVLAGPSHPARQVEKRDGVSQGMFMTSGPPRSTVADEYFEIFHRKEPFNSKAFAESEARLKEATERLAQLKQKIADYYKAKARRK